MVDRTPINPIPLSVSARSRFPVVRKQEPGNDFESVVFPRHPLLSEIKSELLRAGARRAALSGTGSAIFGVFGSTEEAARALPRLSPFGVARVTRPLSRPEYLRRIWGVAKW